MSEEGKKKRSMLEIAFSEKLSRALPEICAFALQNKMDSFLIFCDEKDNSGAERVAAFYKQAQERGIKCRVALPWGRRELQEYFVRRNLRLQFRICSETELSSFLTEKAAFPGSVLELSYDKQVQDNWNIADAMEECRKAEVEFSFGCSESFISASTEDLQTICGKEAKIPFPGGYSCFRFAETLFLDRDGSFYPCRNLKELPAGNIFSENFDGSVENSTVVNYYTDFAEKIKKPCKGCEYFISCAGCRGRAFAYSGDFLSADPACCCNLMRKGEIAQLPVRDPENYLPHKKPMLMISELLRIRDKTFDALSVVQQDNPFLRPDGQLDPAAFIEIGAQGMAFLDTFLHPGARLQGMLVEVNKFEYSGIPVFAQTTLKIHGEKIYEMPPWNIGGFKIFSAGDELIAEGEVKVCQFQGS